MRTAIPTLAALLLVCGLQSPALAASTRLQYTVDSALNAQPGTAVVADLATGKILAAHNLPLAAQRLAKPGSAIKPFVLLTLLRQRVLSPTEAFTCPRLLTVGTTHLDCTHPPSAQPFTAVTALAWSCNNYFATMGQRLPSSALLTELRHYGFASTSGLAPLNSTPQFAEVSAELRPPQSPEQRILQSIGEYGIEVTPLALIGAYRRLALEYFGSQPSTKQTSSDPALATVFAGMEASVKYGMAHNASVASLRIVGKTGTAASGKYSNTRGWFAGIAYPATPTSTVKPIAVVVYLERGRGSDAAAIAGKIFQSWINDQSRQPAQPAEQK